MDGELDEWVRSTSLANGTARMTGYQAREEARSRRRIREKVCPMPPWLLCLSLYVGDSLACRPVCSLAHQSSCWPAHLPVSFPTHPLVRLSAHRPAHLHARISPSLFACARIRHQSVVPVCWAFTCAVSGHLSSLLLSCSRSRPYVSLFGRVCVLELPDMLTADVCSRSASPPSHLSARRRVIGCACTKGIGPACSQSSCMPCSMLPSSMPVVSTTARSRVFALTVSATSPIPAPRRTLTLISSLCPSPRYVRWLCLRRGQERRAGCDSGRREEGTGDSDLIA